MDANRDLSVIFHSLRKKLGKKSLARKIEQAGDDYLHEVTYSPGCSSVNSTTNFCYSEGRPKSKLKRTLLNSRHITNQQHSYSNESNANDLLASSLISNHFKSPPVDRYDLIYYSLILSGIGFLLPYNSFVIGAVDYFQDHYPNTTIIFDLSSIYIIVQFIAVCINNTLISLISFETRIFFGYCLSLATLLIVSIFEIGYELFVKDSGYQLNLFFIAIVAFGCTVQQSSFYGLSSMLPIRYTQAIMIGESLSGLVISVSRIMTKFFIKDEQLNTLIFFVISIFILILCLLINYLIKDDEFVKYYVNNSRKENANLESCPSHTSLNTIPKSSIQENNIELIVKFNGANSVDVPKSDSTEFDLPFGIDDEELVFYVQQSTILNNNTSSATSTTNRACLPNYCKRSSSQIELETHLINQNDTHLNLESLAGSLQHDSSQYQPKNMPSDGQERKITQFLSNIFLFIFYFKQHLANGLEERLKIVYLIYQHMISICLTYFLTLSLFPGIESVIENCSLKSWTPIILFTIFNLTDLIGKYSTKYLFWMSGRKLLFYSSIRFLLLPLFILCIIPNDQPILSNFIFIFIFTSLLGISNGIFGSLPMILAPKFVTNKKELTGNLMSMSYSLGLSLGTILSYLIEFMFLDARHHHSICE